MPFCSVRQQDVSMQTSVNVWVNISFQVLLWILNLIRVFTLTRPFYHMNSVWSKWFYISTGWMFRVVVLLEVKSLVVSNRFSSKIAPIFSSTHLPMNSDPCFCWAGMQYNAATTLVHHTDALSRVACIVTCSKKFNHSLLHASWQTVNMILQLSPNNGSCCSHIKSRFFFVLIFTMPLVGLDVDFCVQMIISCSVSHFPAQNGE